MEPTELAEGVPELSEELESSGYTSGTSPLNSQYELLDQAFQTPLVLYSGTSNRSVLNFSQPTVNEGTIQFQFADVEVPLPAVQSTYYVSEEQLLHPEPTFDPRFNICVTPLCAFSNQVPDYRQYLFDINLRQKASQRSLQICRTCFQQIISTRNLPCLCKANCLMCAPEMRKCSSCGQTILEFVHLEM
ncbi:uncharacterized protein LOC131956573 [Physella acuta]|uniref:uncharacterized protein LOC131956573 n=1 Tax=Physella acuta TaxID=109671 RepID=UPI0027DC1689|nr:uncharacterized protein LOC131956573 [Physella acuta]XP_059177076.1 uncharacterized protein LOC131956573 [Physella acuta]